MAKTRMLRVRVSEAELEAWRVRAGSVGLSAWLRGLANGEAAKPRGVAPGSPGKAARLRVAREALQGAPGRSSVPQQRPEVLRRADAAVAALQAAGEPAAVEEPAPAAVDEPAPDPMRPGRCRDHPNALPRFNDPGRCAWGCRLPPG